MLNAKLMIGVFISTLVFPRVSASAEFWEAMHALDFEYTKTHQLSSNLQEFSRLLELAVEGELNQAQYGFRNLMLNSKDSAVAVNSGRILSELWRIQSNWQAFVDAESMILATGDNTFSIIQELSQAPAEYWVYPNLSTVMPVEMSESGTPVIEVEVNGRIKRFWIDTGASFSIVGSDIAGECDINPLGNDPARVQTGTSRKLVVKGAVIDSLKIESIVAYNHPVMLIDSDDLKIKVPGKTLPIKIDGIIGYNAIQKMDLVIDYYNNQVIIDEPVARSTANEIRNLFWMGVPIIKTLSMDGIPLYYFIDTGASRTALYEGIFKKIRFSNIDSQRVTISSAGGFEEISVKKVPDLKVVTGNDTISMVNLVTVPQTIQSFVELDGIIGSDVFQKKTMHIDHVNGYFEIYP